MLIILILLILFLFYKVTEIILFNDEDLVQFQRGIIL